MSVLTAAAANAAFDAAGRVGGVGTPVAVVDEGGRAVCVTDFGLALLGAADRADFERKFLSGEGPGARRLRRLAAEPPIAGEARLERILRLDGMRATSVNLRCVRVVGADGATLLVLAADDAAYAPVAAEKTVDPAPTDSPPAHAAEARRRSRFLWGLDKEGRFGPLDPVLAVALGTAGPHAGETAAEVLRRAAPDHAEALTAALDKRETFSGFKVLWGLSDNAHALPIVLSGAPLFDEARDFAGFKGFGTIGEPVEATKPAAPSAERAKLEALEAPAPLVADREPEPQVDAADEIPSPAVSAESEQPAPPSQADAALPSNSLTSDERTAAIYDFRHRGPPPPAPAKVVPIRPGAFETSKTQETGEAGDGSVELSKAEREAFREIARALVGRAPATRQNAPPVEPERPVEPPAPSETPTAEPAQPLDWSLAPAEPAAPFMRNALALVDRLPIGLMVARDLEPLYLNQTLLALLGYRDLEHFKAADGLATMFSGEARSGLAQADDGVLSVLTADGRALAVEGRAQAVVWDDAPATLIVLRPSAPARPDDRPVDLAAPDDSDTGRMLDLATDGAVVLDTAGRIQSFNASAERLFSYRADEVAGESVLMLLAPPSHPAATARLDALSARGEKPASEYPIAVTGRERGGAPLDLTLTLARIGSPETPHFCALFRDMRREREAERRLAAARDAAIAASEAKTEFLAHVSHEIRTPLHAILGFAEVMMEERFGPIGNERYRDYLKDIHTSGRHVVSLADDLLDLSKIESGKLELAFSPVDANGLIRDCVSLMQPQAARERIIMRVSLFEKLPRVMVDERSLKQIMLNLMSNAVKYNEPGGQVIVSTAVDAAGQAIIRVRDTGVGMNESEVGVALEPFGQVGKGARKGGVGLGLPLTKALIEANRAEFSIKSRRDHGTLVEICFPIVQAAQ